MKAPTTNELKAILEDIVDRVYAVGLEKHGAHVWYEHETVRHHTDRAIRHVCTANMRRDLNETCVSDGENEIDHLERAIVRALFALVKIHDNHK